VTWRGIDAAEGVARRFFKLETLASATEFALQRGERFILSSVRHVTGEAPIERLSFEFFTETSAKLVFRVRAATATRKEALFAFVVAKDAEPYSARMAAERANLALLARRTPDAVLAVLNGGTLHLPDRYRRAGGGRDIYAYMARWPVGYHELGVGRRDAFFLPGPTPQPLTPAQTQAIKAQVVALVAATYNPASHDAIEMPDLCDGDLLATHPRSGAVRIRFLTCRGMVKRTSRSKVLHKALSHQYVWQGERIPLAPQAPDLVVDALARRLGAEMSRVWLLEYIGAVRDGRFLAPRTFSIDLLEQALGDGGTP